MGRSGERYRRNHELFTGHYIQEPDEAAEKAGQSKRVAGLID